MSSMTPCTPTDAPTLPLEIYDHIVNIIGRQPPGTPLTDEQSNTLQSISLVSKSFVALAKTHLLRNVRIELAGANRGRLHNLVQMIETKPSLANFIQGVIINLEFILFDDHDRLDSETGQRYNSFLVELPKLHAITVMYPYIEESMEEEPEFQGFSNLFAICGNLMESLALRGALSFLKVVNVEKLPPSIFACPLLQSLSIRSGQAIALQCSDSLKSLLLSHMEVPISVLTYFPNLEELSLLWTTLLPITRSHNPLSPPSGLKSLTYRHASGETTDLTLISAFFHHQTSVLEIQPFRFLQTLTLIFGRDVADESGITTLLENIAELHVLSIQVHRAKGWLLSSLCCHQRTNSVLRKIHTLNLTLISEELDDKAHSESFMQNLQSLFASISPDNELKGIHLSLGYFVRGYENRINLEPWPNITQVLTTCSKFRKLEVLEFVLDDTLYDVNRGDNPLGLDSKTTCGANFRKRMDTIVDQLQHACNLNLTYEVQINNLGGWRVEHRVLITYEPKLNGTKRSLREGTDLSRRSDDL
ncbi:hypothetical protein BJ165DRAFT_1488534 [Panaeolus papilionaceus]|nr:hypothetical protein BJ165DRAFT_1488534 [Panaeolus papilionaceus]